MFEEARVAADETFSKCPIKTMGVCAVHFSENDGCSDFKIVQYFHAVICINFLNAITELFKILNDVILGNKGKARTKAKAASICK